MKCKWMMCLLLLLCVSAEAQRPRPLWVERVVTPDRSRQLKVALNSTLWIMYDLPQCQLYQAWNGGTNGGTLEKANFGWFDQNAHFNHWFTTSGNNYFKEAVGEYFASWTKPADITTYYTKWKAQPRNYQAWTVANGGTALDAKTRYRGYFVNGTEFKLSFGLALANGEINVTEIPEYANTGGKVNLVRKLALTGIPAGHSVTLKLPAGGNWAVSGTGALQGGNMVQSADGETTITGSW